MNGTVSPFVSVTLPFVPLWVPSRLTLLTVASFKLRASGIQFFSSGSDLNWVKKLYSMMSASRLLSTTVTGDWAPMMKMIIPTMNPTTMRSSGRRLLFGSVLRCGRLCCKIRFSSTAGVQILPPAAFVAVVMKLLSFRR